MRWPILLLAVMMMLPGPPAGAAPTVLSTFSGGAATVDVEVEPRPSVNSSLGVTLPWDADVRSASLAVRGEGLPETRNEDHDAASLASGDLLNLTIDSNKLRLNRSSWSWDQEGASLGSGCEISGGRLDNGLRLEHSNPSLSASGGGIWKNRMAVELTETGGTARQNESIDVHLSFSQSVVCDPQKDIRVCNASYVEIPSDVRNASFVGGWCTGADVLFVAPAIAPYSKDTYFIYFGNSLAGRPSYGYHVYFADGFSAPSLPPHWTVTNLDWLTYSAEGVLRVNGTATCTTASWQGVSFDCYPELPQDFSMQAKINLSGGYSNGYRSFLSLVQDSQNFIDFGIVYDSGVPQYVPAKYVLITGQGGAVSLAASSDAVCDVCHLFRIDRTAGTFRAYIDGGLLGSASATLSSPHIQLSASPRDAGDCLNVSFDEVIAHAGYSDIEVLDPPPVQTPGGEENAGFAAACTMISPLIENSARLPLGLITIGSDVGPGTSANVSVLGPDNQTIVSGLGNADSVLISPEEYPAIRLCATLATSDPGTTPRLLSWGIGGRWIAGLKDAAFSVNLTVSQSSIGLSLSPERWTKLASPALSPGIASTFDDMGVARPCVLFSEGLYRMYFAGYDGVHWRVGLAMSDDGLSWTRYPDNPVLVPGGVLDWDSSHVNWPFVVYNGTGYQMWYAGSSDGGASWGIGYASSRDGVHWTKQPGPVISGGGPGSWNSVGVSAPRILLQGSTYTMWYAGQNATSSAIGIATSSDGIIWNESLSNPVLLPQPGWSSAGVMPGGIEAGPGQTYLMWFSGSNSTVSGVGYAASPDGTSWNVSPRPVLSNGTGGAFDRLAATNVSVMFSAGGLMWYSAYNGTRWRICSAKAGHFPEGDFLSAPVDLGIAPASVAISLWATVPANCSITASARSSSDGTGWNQWTALNASPTPLPAKRYLQWKAHLVAGNESSPTLELVCGSLEYHCLQGQARLPPIVLSGNQDLSRVTASVTADGPGSVLAEASIDGGTNWSALDQAKPQNLSGGRLDIRVLLSGNYTSSPSLVMLSVSYSILNYPADVGMDVGGDGTVEWNRTGTLDEEVTVGDLSTALNTYLEAHRNDPGDRRTVPLALSSSARGVIKVSGLKVEYDAKLIPNHLPEIRSTPPDRAQVGQPFYYHVDARDSDPRDVLSYSLPTAPEGMSMSSAGDMSWVPSAWQVGYHQVVLVVSDGHGLSEQNFTVVVSNGLLNLPPEITSVPPGTARVGYEYVYRVTATDPNSEPIHFSLSASNPDGATIDADTGHLSWVPGPAQGGVNAFEVLVSDPTDTVHHRFSVNVSLEGVNSLPSVQSSPPAAARVNLSCIYHIIASDTDGDTLTFSLISGPSGATVSSDGTFEWTARATTPSKVNIMVRISDGKGFAPYSFSLNVLPENRPPIFQGLPTVLKVIGGQSWTYTPQVSDPDGDRNLTFVLVSGPSGMTVDSSSGLVSWRPGSSLSGTFTVSISVSDGLANSTQDFSLKVQSGVAGKGILEGWWPVLAIAAIAAAVLAAGAVVLRRKRAEPGPEDKEEEPEPRSEPAAPKETYENEAAGICQPGAQEGLATLPPPEVVAGAAEAEPMKPVAKVPATPEPSAPISPPSEPSAAPYPPAAPSAPISPLSEPTVAPSPPAALSKPASKPFSFAQPSTSFAPASPPASKPAPPSRESVSIKDDMDFLRSYLSEKQSPDAPKPEAAKMEWQQIKEYAQGLEKDVGKKGVEESREPAARKPESAVAPTEEKRKEETPKEEKRKEETPKGETIPSLDDILKELDES